MLTRKCLFAGASKERNTVRIEDDAALVLYFVFAVVGIETEKPHAPLCLRMSLRPRCGSPCGTAYTGHLVV
jgi:hypothetical protein